MPEVKEVILKITDQFEGGNTSQKWYTFSASITEYSDEL